MQIDLEGLAALLRSDPLWYLKVYPILKEINKLSETNREEYEPLKEKVYDVFEAALDTNKIILGDEVGIWDDERQPIDTIVAHHTSNAPGISFSRLSAIELYRIYVPAYASPAEGDKAKVMGKPISSGHIRGGKQVFYSYHRLIRQDGREERLLDDTEIGWQAGKWSVNCRSAAICFDGDFENSRPSDAELKAAARVIRLDYPQVPKENILGHCEVRETSCPSKLFLSKDGQRGWKEDLLALVW